MNGWESLIVILILSPVWCLPIIGVFLSIAAMIAAARGNDVNIS